MLKETTTIENVSEAFILGFRYGRRNLKTDSKTPVHEI